MFLADRSSSPPFLNGGDGKKVPVVVTGLGKKTGCKQEDFNCCQQACLLVLSLLVSSRREGTVSIFIRYDDDNDVMLLMIVVELRISI